MYPMAQFWLDLFLNLTLIANLTVTFKVCLRQKVLKLNGDISESFLPTNLSKFLQKGIVEPMLMKTSQNLRFLERVYNLAFTRFCVHNSLYARRDWMSSYGLSTRLLTMCVWSIAFDFIDLLPSYITRDMKPGTTFHTKTPAKLGELTNRITKKRLVRLVLFSYLHYFPN